MPAARAHSEIGHCHFCPRRRVQLCARKRQDEYEMSCRLSLTVAGQNHNQLSSDYAARAARVASRRRRTERRRGVKSSKEVDTRRPDAAVKSRGSQWPPIAPASGSTKVASTSTKEQPAVIRRANSFAFAHTDQARPLECSYVFIGIRPSLLLLSVVRAELTIYITIIVRLCNCNNTTLGFLPLWFRSAYCVR